MVSGMPEEAYRLVKLFEQYKVFCSCGTIVIHLMENNRP